MFKVQGLVSWIGDLVEAGVSAPRRAADAVRGATEATAQTMRETVPVHDGILRDSIETEVNGLTGEARATAPHAPFVEYGTFKDPPQPYASPAADEHFPEFEKELGDVAGDI